MAETLLQKAQRLNIQPTNQPQESPTESLVEKAKRLGIQPEKPEKKDGAITSFVKDIVRPVATIVARPIQAGAAVFGADLDKIDEVTKKVAGDLVAPVPRSGKDVVKDIGRAAETVSFGLGGGAVKGAVKAGLKTTLGTAVKASAKEGAKVGALGGFGAGLSKEGEVGEALKSAAIGAGAGLALGGAIPVVSKGIGETISLGRKGLGVAKTEVESRLASRAAREAEETALLKSGASDARVAGKVLEKGQVVKDRVASEAIKQGIPEADVALIKSSSKTDKSKMSKMLSIRKEQLVNKRTTARATDVVGDTFINQAKFIANKNTEARNRLNVIAQKLAGKRADPSKALTSFAGELESSGISISKKGGLNFKGSDFEGIRGAQTAIENVWLRALKIAKTGDALQMHRMKRFIDEVVDYGKTAEGLSGRAQNILKGFRRNIDGILDTKFPTYNRVNTEVAETLGELNKINQAMGRRFKLGDSFADARAGITMRRILSNTQSRSEILQLLESMQAVARKQGMKIDDDIIAQANFADTLEKLFKSEAPTSFLGQIERGVQATQDITGVAGELAKGRPVAATTRALATGLQRLRGINQENQMKALEALLKSGGTNFGKAVK